MPAGGVELVLHQALAAKGTVGFVLLGAAAGLGGLSGVTLANDLAVVVGDDVPKIGHIYIYIYAHSRASASSPTWSIRQRWSRPRRTGRRRWRSTSAAPLTSKRDGGIMTSRLIIPTTNMKPS